MDIPTHIAIIVDGNRRWAKQKGLPTFEGHRRGFMVVKKFALWCFEKGIKYVSFYVFSTENWKRSQKEVDYLLNILLAKDVFEKSINYFQTHNIKVVISGQKNPLPQNLFEKSQSLVKLTKNNDGGVINFCLNYGGRNELVDAFNKIIKKKVAINKIDEKLIRQNLYQPHIPDPDLIVRTSGEQRLSNFLLWQSAYSELLFIRKNWPDINKNDLVKILEEYSNRQRRFGK